MRLEWLVVVSMVALVVQVAGGSSQESSTYLGKKLEYVLENVDNAYIQERKTDLVSRHRKGFQKLGEHLEKRYPDLEPDVTRWLEKNYPESMGKNAEGGEVKKGFPIEAILAIDRSHPEFRQRFTTYLQQEYPGLYDEIASFLRDNHVATLQEVLRLTLRMTSHVPSSTVADRGDSLGGESGGKPAAPNVPGSISMIP